MKKIIIINILLFSSIITFAQKGNKILFTEYEDTLKVLAKVVMNGDSENQRYAANQAFIKHFWNRKLQQ